MEDDIDFVCSLCRHKILLCGGICRYCNHYNAPYLGNSGFRASGDSAQPLSQQSNRSDHAKLQELLGRRAAQIQAPASESVRAGSTSSGLGLGLGNLDLHSADTADAIRDNASGQIQAIESNSIAARGGGGRGGRGGRGGVRAARQLDAQGRPKIHLTCTDDALQVREPTDAEKKNVGALIMLERERAKMGIWSESALPTLAGKATEAATPNRQSPSSRAPSTTVQIPGVSSPAMAGNAPQAPKASVQTPPLRVLDKTARDVGVRPLGNAKPLTLADMTRPTPLASMRNLMPSVDTGYPVLPDPPCSAKNPKVWPYDFDPYNRHQAGTVRTMVWPCKCQFRFPNGRVCGGSHPTVLHNKRNMFLEIWLPKRVLGEKFLCTICTERRGQGRHNHDTEDHGKGMWRMLPGCPVDELDSHLQKFVKVVPRFSNLQPFHVHLYNPTDFQPPSPQEGWPTLPDDLPRLVQGYFLKGSSFETVANAFVDWCRHNRLLLGIPAPVIAGNVPTATVNSPAAVLQVVTPPRIGWSGFDKGHPDLAPPDFTYGHHLWFNLDFERDMDKCLNTYEREQIQGFKEKWISLHKKIDGEPSDELKSLMNREVGSAWDIYRHLYPHWTPVDNWVAPATVKDWRNGRRAALRVQTKKEMLNPSDICLNYNGLDKSLDFDPLPSEKVSITFKDWSDIEEEDDSDEEEDVLVDGCRKHPQLAPRTVEDAKYHLYSWIKHMQKFLGLNDRYRAWITEQEIQGRPALASKFFGNKKVSPANAETQCGAQDRAFVELAVKVESLICELRSTMKDLRKQTGGSIMLTCRKLQGDLGRISREYEETWHMQLCGHLAKGEPEALVAYYKKFMVTDYEDITEVYEGLLGGYMPFPSRTRTALPRFVWPWKFLAHCTEESEEVTGAMSEVQAEESAHQTTPEVKQSESPEGSSEAERVVEVSVVVESVAKEPAVQEPVVEEPVVEEPVVEEPVVEEPVVEEPVVEEPVVEEPVVEKPVVEEPVVEESAKGDHASVDLAVEKPSVEEPVVEEPDQKGQ